MPPPAAPVPTKPKPKPDPVALAAVAAREGEPEVLESVALWIDRGTFAFESLTAPQVREKLATGIAVARGDRLADAIVDDIIAVGPSHQALAAALRRAAAALRARPPTPPDPERP